MKLRQAAKIQRWIEEPGRYGFRCHPRWRRETIWRSRTVCHRHDRFKRQRLPYIPSDGELEERLDIAAGLFAGLLKHQGYDLPKELDEIAFDFSILDEMSEAD